MTGDWDALFRTLSDQTKLGRDIGRANLKPAAEIVADRAREKLGVYQGAVGNFPAWDPLKPDTIAHKKDHADTPLLETKQLRDDITVGEVVVDSNRHATVTIGILADAESAVYAGVMEMGRRDQSVPARPFLGPALYEVKQMVRDEIKAQIRATF